eukprot:TRINITY_DN70250_c0_g1_i5.p3 TRINITY_DN70250_c0_g1~~TRINITY_DN70250_c0_g1_i5.p3  ORF type:complete len:142 (+),score=4.17 TRINITY_DN70250_c0_g1_i5:117-542(+)
MSRQMGSPIELLQMLCDELNLSSFLVVGDGLVVDEQSILEEASRTQETRTNVPYTKSGQRYDHEQGIVCARMTNNGHVLLRITPLLAAFVEGVNQRQIQQICNKSGGCIRCWTISYIGASHCQYNGHLRNFLIEGCAQPYR